MVANEGNRHDSPCAPWKCREGQEWGAGMVVLAHGEIIEKVKSGEQA